MQVGEHDTQDRRIWGMSARQVHDCFWASRGVQVVRQRTSDRPADPLPDARLYLLLDADALVIFPPHRFLGAFAWPESEVVVARVQHRDSEDYQELAQTTEDGRLVRFERCYQRSTARSLRIAVTRSRKLAALWRSSRRARSVGRFLRNTGYWDDLEAVVVEGEIYDAACQHDQERLLCDLVRAWTDVDSAVANVRQAAPGVWAHRDAEIAPGTRFIGPAWVGASRGTAEIPSVLGPAVLWDARGAQRPVVGAAAASPEIRRSTRVSALAVVDAAGDIAAPRRTAAPSVYQLSKRGFDIVVSLAALLVMLPLYPLVMLAIWLEDGRPFFFVHCRETRGGREFGCVKFRTMRRDAEAIKQQLDTRNECDGPQFFMTQDPRVTRVGAFLRKHHLDEWPQFWNVLRGEMSLVGPRPSPFRENQFCPPWREARLSVRAGVTGLWQVQRTRRAGCDFREWIECDVQYVQQQGWRMDLYVLWRTVQLLLPRRKKLAHTADSAAAYPGDGAGEIQEQLTESVSPIGA